VAVTVNEKEVMEVTRVDTEVAGSVECRTLMEDIRTRSSQEAE
jgi:hypothetical protein